jgi:hypothetical protein
MMCPICTSDTVIGSQIRNPETESARSWLECACCGWESEPLNTTDKDIDVWITLEHQISTGYGA